MRTRPVVSILKSSGVGFVGGGSVYPGPTGSPEAVARLRLRQNVACGFPAECAEDKPLLLHAIDARMIMTRPACSGCAA